MEARIWRCSLAGFARAEVYPPRMTTHEALWPKDLFEQGIGWVIVARFKSAGQRVEAGVFLLDVYCLGVKLAGAEATSSSVPSPSPLDVWGSPSTAVALGRPKNRPGASCSNWKSTAARATLITWWAWAIRKISAGYLIKRGAGPGIPPVACLTLTVHRICCSYFSFRFLVCV